MQGAHELRELRQTAAKRVLQLQEAKAHQPTTPLFKDGHFFLTVVFYVILMAMGQVVEYYFQAEDLIVFYTGLPQTYAIPTLVYLASFCLLSWLDFNLLQAETRYAVPSPHGFAGSPGVREQEKPLVENAQKLRQDVRDKYPIFAISLAIACQKHPLTASLAGFVWVLGCYNFCSHGYASKAEMALPYRQRRSVWCLISMVVLHSIMTAYVISQFYQIPKTSE